jgi:Uncharacterized protein conserved in bacteria (DUF2325)
VEQLKTIRATGTTGSATLGVTTPMIAEAPRPDVILLACLHAVEDLSAHLLSGLRQEAVNGAGCASSHHAHNIDDSFSSHLLTLLEKKFHQVVESFSFLRINRSTFFLQHTGLTRTVRHGRASNSPSFVPAEGSTTASKLAGSHQALLSRIDLLERKLADAKIPVPPETDWVPLVKVSAAPGAPGTLRASPRPGSASAAEPAWGCDSLDEKQDAAHAGFDLAGRRVLCVGGRAALYPEYHRMVEASGGRLLIYRRGPLHGGDHLPALLDHADLVVCPVDCVNHYAYFTVKRYCKYSGKPCVLLDRSGLPTFRKGVATLAALATPPARCGASVQSTKSTPIV